MVVDSNPVAVTETSNFAPVSSKEFLDIQVTAECRFTLNHVCDMTRTHSLPVIVGIFSSKFTWINVKVNFLVNRHVSRGDRISYIAHHLEQTDNKPFSGLMTTSRAVAHQSWGARCFLRVL